jgi:tetratricopeptide (TPR) repeat protein
VLSLAALLFAVLWILKSLLVFCLYRYVRDYDQMGLLDGFAFPANRSELVHRQGLSHIADARKAMEEGDFRNAFFLLRVGLARAPEDRDARLSLAGVYRMLKDQENCIQTLRNGLEYHSSDVEYVKVYVQTLLSMRMDDEICEYARARMQATTGEPDLPTLVAAFSAAQVSKLNGDYKGALSFLDNYKLSETVDGCMLLASCHWAGENREKAVSILSNFQLRHPVLPVEALHAMLCSYQRQMGRNTEAMKSALVMVSNLPKSPSARLELLRCYNALAMQDRCKTEATRYLRDFSSDGGAVHSLAVYAVEVADPWTATQAYLTAAERGYNMGAFGVEIIKAHLAAGQYDVASGLCRSLTDEKPKWLDRYEAQFSFMRAAAARGLGQDDVADVNFSLLLQSDIGVDELSAMGGLLVRMKMLGDALEVYMRARHLDPRNEVVLAAIVKIDLALGLDTEFVANLDALLDLRRPEYALLRSARARLTGDHFIFDPRRDAVLARLDEVLQEPAQLREVAQ